MQVNETLVRTVVEEVLHRLKGNGTPAAPPPVVKRFQGRLGLFTDCLLYTSPSPRDS